jgi:Domain of unknown function (DUF6434)
MAAFDWHSNPLTRETPVIKDCRTTQNVRRFLAAQLSAEIHLDRPFMAWIRSGAPKSMGDVADELGRRRPGEMGRGR